MLESVCNLQISSGLLERVCWGVGWNFGGGRRLKTYRSHGACSNMFQQSIVSTRIHTIQQIDCFPFSMWGCISVI